MKGNEKVVIRASVSTWTSGSGVKSDYETDYTYDEWNELSEYERECVLDEYCSEHASNFSESCAWVKDEDDEEL